MKFQRLVPKHIFKIIFIFCISLFILQEHNIHGEEIEQYKIRPGDILEILIPLNVELDMISKIPFSEGQFELFGNEIFAKKTIEVDPYGGVFLPLVGHVVIKGKTPEQLSKELSESLKKYIYNVRCEILVKKSSPYNIYIFGEVTKPNKIQVDREITAFEAIAMAGGFTKAANKKKIKVIRHIKNGYRIFTINLYDAIKKNNLEENIILENDDIVIVAESFF